MFYVTGETIWLYPASASLFIWHSTVYSIQISWMNLTNDRINICILVVDQAFNVGDGARHAYNFQVFRMDRASTISEESYLRSASTPLQQRWCPLGLIGSVFDGKTDSKTSHRTVYRIRNRSSEKRVSFHKNANRFGEGLPTETWTVGIISSEIFDICDERNDEPNKKWQNTPCGNAINILFSTLDATYWFKLKDYIIFVKCEVPLVCSIFRIYRIGLRLPKVGACAALVRSSNLHILTHTFTFVLHERDGTRHA